MLFLPTCCLFTVYLLTIRWFYNSCCLFCAVHFVLLLLTLFLPTCCLSTVYLLTRWFYNPVVYFVQPSFCVTAVDVVLAYLLFVHCVFVGDKMVLQLHLSVLCSLHSASDRQDSDPTCHLECQVGQTGLRQTGPQMPGHWGLSGHSSQHSSESIRFSFLFFCFVYFKTVYLSSKMWVCTVQRSLSVAETEKMVILQTYSYFV